MSSKNLETVIQRAISDAAFRRQLQADPEGALRGFKLTSEEMAALRSADAGRLMSLGIDQRMSKTFAISDLNAASRVSPGSDVSGASAVSDDFPRITAHEPGAIGDPILPRATQMGAAPLEGTPEATAADMAAARASESTRSAVRDVEPTDLSGSGTAAAIEGSPEATSADMAAARASETTRSAVRDVDPVDVGGGVTQTYSGDDIAGPGYLMGSEAETAARAVRDVEPSNIGSSQVGYGEAYPAHGGLAGASQAGEPTMGTRAVREGTGTDYAASSEASSTMGTRAIREGTAESSSSMGTRAVREGTGDSATTAATTGETTSNEALSADGPEAYAPSFHALESTDTTTARAVRDVEPSDAFLSTAEADTYTAVDGNQIDEGSVDETAQTDADEVVVRVDEDGNKITDV